MTNNPVAAPLKKAADTLRKPLDRADAPIAIDAFCDQCSVARAVVRATVKQVPLHFCGHHFREHRDSLESNPAIHLYVKELDL